MMPWIHTMQFDRTLCIIKFFKHQIRLNDFIYEFSMVRKENRDASNAV